MRLLPSTVCAGLVAAALCATAGPARPAGDFGLEHYVNHRFDEAIEAAKSEKRAVQARLVMGLAYTERYNIYKTKPDKESAAMYLKPLAVDVTMKDVDTIRNFLNVPGNPNGNKEAAALLKVAFKQAKSTPEEILHMARFVGSDLGIDVTQIALDEIEKRLAPVREYVGKGGVMPDAMRKDVFSNPLLIQPLVAALAEKKTAGKATKCLVLIQDPAIEHLEQAEASMGVSDAVVAVKKAIQGRLKKHPESTWNSATGD